MTMYKNLGVIILVISLLFPLIYGMDSSKVIKSLEGEITVIAHTRDLENYTRHFNQIYPNIKVNYRFLSDYETQMKLLIETGDYGDVLFIPDFIRTEQLETYFEPLGSITELKDKYRFTSSRNYRQKAYGIPMRANVNGFVYNKKVFAEAGITQLPTTIEGFIEALEKIKRNTTAIPFYTNYTEGWALSIWEIFSYGAMSGDADYRNNGFLNEENPFLEGSNHYQVYKLLYDIVQKGLCEEDILNGSWGEAKQLFSTGKLGVIAMSSWVIAQLKAENEIPENVGYMAFPNEVDGKLHITVNEDYSYGINRHSKNKAAARAWIDFIIDDSGAALKNDTISIVKSDPYPESLSSLKDVEFILDQEMREENFGKYEILSQDLNLYSSEMQKSIIEAGLKMASFEEILLDWNKRWETYRSQIPVKEVTNETDPKKQQIIIEDVYKLVLSEHEKQYIKDATTIKVGYLKSYEPIQYMKDGKFLGISAELFKLMEEQTGLVFEYIPLPSYEVAIEKLRNNELDAIAGLEQVVAEEAYISYSKAYLDYVNVIIRNQRINPNALSDYTMAVVEGSLNDYAVSQMKYYKTLEACIEAIEREEADFTICNYLTYNATMRGKSLKQSILQPLTGEGLFSVAFRKEMDSTLIAIINKVIYSLSEEQKQAIIFNNTEVGEIDISLKTFIEAHPVFSVFMVMGSCGSILLIVGYIMLVQHQYNKKLALSTKKYELLSDIAGEYIFEYSYKDNMVYFSEKFIDQFGGQIQYNLNQYDEMNLSYKYVLTILEGLAKGEKIEVQCCLKEGKTQWFRAIASISYDEVNEPDFLVGKLVNIQAEVEERIQLGDEAQKDALTGIYNRKGFLAAFEQKALKGETALFVIDMDDFKVVNDTLGHSGGDELIKRLVEQLQYVFKEEAIIGRFGGDEFIACLFDVTQTTQIEEKARALCQAMDTEITYQGKACKVSISVGVAKGKGNYNELFEQADQSLYEVKKQGRNNYKLYEMPIGSI